MELTQFPSAQCSTDNRTFEKISDGNLSLILSFVHAEKIEEWMLMRANDTIKNYTDKEIREKFLSMPIYYLVNKLFLKIHLQLIDNIYRDNHFSYQGYFRALSEEKEIMNKKYHQSHLDAILEFIDSTVNLKTNPFSNFNPLYKVTKKDLKNFVVSPDDSNGNFIYWISDYLSTYNKKFGKQKSYNLFTLVALTLVKLNKKVFENSAWHLMNADRLIKSKDLLMIFYQMFFNGPFCSQAKNLFLKYFIASSPDEIQKCFCYGSSAHLSPKERIENLTKFLYGNNSLLQKSALALLKKHLVPSKYSKPRVSVFDKETKEFVSIFGSNKADLNFILSMYLSIFDINNNLVLQESLKDDFKKFFLENNYNHYLEIINTVRAKKFDFWTVFEQLYRVMDYELLEKFLTNYSPVEIITSYKMITELRISKETYLSSWYDCEKSFLDFFQSFDMVSFLTEIAFNADTYHAMDLKKYSFGIHMIGLFDLLIARSEVKKWFGIRALNIILFDIAKKTNLGHEDIAQKMGLKNYKNHYQKALKDSEFLKETINLKPFQVKQIERLIKYLEPDYFFLNGPCFCELFFECKNHELLIFRKNIVKRLIINPVNDNNKLQSDRALRFIKNVIQFDVGKCKSLNDLVESKKSLNDFWYVSCLPFIIAQSKELKELIAQDSDLMSKIDLVYNTLQVMSHDNVKIDTGLNDFLLSMLSVRNNDVSIIKLPEQTINNRKEELPNNNEGGQNQHGQYEGVGLKENDFLLSMLSVRNNDVSIIKLPEQTINNRKEELPNNNEGGQNQQGVYEGVGLKEAEPPQKLSRIQQIGKFLKKIITRQVIGAGLLISGFAFLAWQVQKKLSNFTRIFAEH